MVGDENHFQKGSQLQEEIASGISKGRKANEKLFSPYFRFQSWLLFPFLQGLSSRGKKKQTKQHEHSVIVLKICSNFLPRKRNKNLQHEN